MTHEVQAKTSLKQIFFDDGEAYVFGRIPKEKYRVVDKLGRTKEEKKFLDAFVRIFIAAGDGDLQKCQTIVEQEKFSDVDAYSVGNFHCNQIQISLDYVSPRQIAAVNDHTNITDYFTSKFGVRGKSAKTLDQVHELGKNEDYKRHKNIFKEHVENGMDTEVILSIIRIRLLTTYSLRERKELGSAIEKCDADQLLGLLKIRCTQKFTYNSGYEEENRIELCAYRDCLAEGI